MFVWGYCKEKIFSDSFFQRVKADVLEPPGHFPCPYIAKVSPEGKKSESEDRFSQPVPLFALNFQIYVLRARTSHWRQVQCV